MAITHIAQRGTGVAIASGSTLAITTTGAAVAVGRQLLVAFVSDNIATADGNSNTHTSVADSVGNTYVKIYEYTNAPSAATLVGVTTSLWLCNVTVQIPIGGTITLTLSATTAVDKVGYANEFSVAAGQKLGLVTGTGSPSGQEVTAAAGFGSAVISGLASAARLYFRALGKEANSITAITVTANFTTTGGTLRSRNATTAVLAAGEFRINTSTGETSNPTLAVTGDSAAVFAAFNEVTNSVNATANPSGASSTSAAGSYSVSGAAGASVSGHGASSAGGAVSASGAASVSASGQQTPSALGTWTASGTSPDATASPSGVGATMAAGAATLSAAARAILTTDGFESLTNVTLNYPLLSKTGGVDGAPDGRAIGILPNNFEFEFTITEPIEAIVGAHGTSAFPVPHYVQNLGWNITDVFFAGPGGYYAEVRQDGVYKAEIYYNVDDILTLMVDGGTAYWKLNGTTVYSAPAPSGRMFLQIALSDTNSNLDVGMGPALGGAQSVASTGTVTASGGTGATAAPNGAGTPTTGGAATASGTASVSPAGQGAPISAGLASAGVSATAQPSGTGSTAAGGSATVSGAAAIAAVGQSVPATVGNWSASAGSPATAEPSGVGAVLASGTAAASGAANVDSSGAGVSLELGIPAAIADALFQSIGISLTVTAGSWVAFGKTFPTDVVPVTVTFTRSMRSAAIAFGGQTTTTIAFGTRKKATAAIRRLVRASTAIRRTVAVTVER